MSALSLNTMRRLTCNTTTPSTLTLLAAATTSSSATVCGQRPKLATHGNRHDQQRHNSSSTATASACPHLANTYGSDSVPLIHRTAEWQNALPYEQIPGPKPIPILGNTWR